MILTTLHLHVKQQEVKEKSGDTILISLIV